MVTISTALQQKEEIQVIKDIIQLGRDNKINMKIEIIQFFIDIFTKNYKLNSNQYEELQNNSTRGIITEIYESEDKPPVELPLEDFFRLLIKKLYIHNLLEPPMLNCWTTFIGGIIECHEIPYVSVMKGKSFLLLAYILEPLTNLLAALKCQESDDLTDSVNEAVRKIIYYIPMSFRYEIVGSSCAKEYAETMKKHYSTILTDIDSLMPFNGMLSYENRSLITTAIKSFDELCKIESIQDLMIEFIFSTEFDDDEESIMETLVEMSNHYHYKALKSDIYSVIISVAKVAGDREIFNDQQLASFSVNIFNKNRKIVSQVLELMVILKVDFWSLVIRVLNSRKKGEEVDDDYNISNLLTSISSMINTDPKVLLQYVVDNIDETYKSRRAAEIFSESLNLHTFNFEILTLMVQSLETIFDDETTFITVLKCFTNIDNALLFDFKDSGSNEGTDLFVGIVTQLLPCLSNAFKEFDKPISLNIIVGVFKKFSVVVNSLVLDAVRKIASFYLNEVKSNNRLIDLMKIEKFIPKITALLEFKGWYMYRIWDLKFLYKFCLKYNKNLIYNNFPQFQRLYVNLVAQMWMLLTQMRSIPIETERLINDVQIMYTTLQEALSSNSYNTKGNCLILLSIMDLLVMFQPNLSTRFQHEIFQKFNISLDKQNFIGVVESVERVITDMNKNEDINYYQHVVMQKFVTLYQDHQYIPSLTSWEIFLEKYTLKSTFKTDIEALMTHAMELKKTIFEKVIAFACLNMATKNINFRPFFHALEDFLRRKISSDRERSVTIGIICSVILDRLSKQIKEKSTGESRLLVLDNVAFMLKNMDESFTSNLKKFLIINEDFLSNAEKDQLNEFIRKIF